jgi:hypothetical protein
MICNGIRICANPTHKHNIDTLTHTGFWRCYLFFVYTHTHIHTHTHTHDDQCMPSLVVATCSLSERTHTRTHTHTHANAHGQKHTQTLTHKHTYKYARMHAQTHPNSHTPNMHTYTIRAGGRRVVKWLLLLSGAQALLLTVADPLLDPPLEPLRPRWLSL